MDIDRWPLVLMQTYKDNCQIHQLTVWTDVAAASPRSEIVDTPGDLTAPGSTVKEASWGALALVAGECSLVHYLLTNRQHLAPLTDTGFRRGCWRSGCGCGCGCAGQILTNGFRTFFWRQGEVIGWRRTPAHPTIKLFYRGDDLPCFFNNTVSACNMTVSALIWQWALQ